jgi:hypothetical protein
LAVATRQICDKLWWFFFGWLERSLQPLTQVHVCPTTAPSGDELGVVKPGLKGESLVGFPAPSAISVEGVSRSTDSSQSV